MYYPEWQMLGLLLIVLCSGLSAIVIKTLLLLLILLGLGLGLGQGQDESKDWGVRYGVRLASPTN